MDKKKFIEFFNEAVSNSKAYLFKNSKLLIFSVAVMEKKYRLDFFRKVRGSDTDLPKLFYNYGESIDDVIVNVNEEFMEEINNKDILITVMRTAFEDITNNIFRKDKRETLIWEISSALAEYEFLKSINNLVNLDLLLESDMEKYRGMYEFIRGELSKDYDSNGFSVEDYYKYLEDKFEKGEIQVEPVPIESSSYSSQQNEESSGEGSGEGEEKSSESEGKEENDQSDSSTYRIKIKNKYDTSIINTKNYVTKESSGSKKDIYSKYVNDKNYMEELSRGLNSGSFIEEILNLYKIRYEWNKILRDSILFSKTGQSNRKTWSEKNIFMRNFKVPGKKYKREKRDTLLIFIDTSGSISDEDLKTFCSVINDVRKYFDKIVLVQHDYNIKDVQEFDCNRKFETFKIHGRGGTSHKECFEFIEKNRQKYNLSYIVFLTDFESDIESFYPTCEDMKYIPHIFILNRKPRASFLGNVNHVYIKEMEK